MTGKETRQRPERQPSKRWATFKEIADHFCTSEATVRLGRGVFARLRRVQLTEGRVVVPRADFERLDRDLERMAVSPAAEAETAGVVPIGARRGRETGEPVGRRA